MGATLQNFYLRNYSHLAVIKGIFKFHVHIYSHNYKHIIRDSVKVSGTDLRPPPCCQRRWKIFFKWAILGLFFIYFRLFYKQLTVNNCSKKIADGWIRTHFLWFRNRPRCQVCHTTAHDENCWAQIDFCRRSTQKKKFCVEQNSLFLCSHPRSSVGLLLLLLLGKSLSTDAHRQFVWSFRWQGRREREADR